MAGNLSAYGLLTVDEAAGNAPLVVLSDDIMTIDEDRIPETRVLATLVGGRVVHDTGLFPAER